MNIVIRSGLTCGCLVDQVFKFVPGCQEVRIVGNLESYHIERDDVCIRQQHRLSVTTITDSAEQGGSDGQLFGVGREAGPSSNTSRVTLSCQRTTITNAIREYVTTDV